MNKTAFCGVEFMGTTWCNSTMHDIWGLYNPPALLDTRKAVTQDLLHLRDRRNLLPFRDVVEASIKSIPTK